jgi:RND family efflux transporter MFP subunit
MTMPKLSRKFLLLPPVILAIVVFIMLKSTQQAPVESTDSAKARKVRSTLVVAQDFVPLAQGYGEVQPAQVWKAIAQVSGRIQHLHERLKDGEIISQGETLFQIDPVDYQLNLAQAEAQLAELEVEQQNASALLEIEQRNLALAQREFERLQKLVKKGSISQSDVDSAERTLLNSRTSVQNYKNTLALFPVNRKLLQVKIDQAQRDLDNTSIKAPFNLRVSGLKIEANQYVSKGEHMFSGDSVDQVEITAQIAMSSLKNLFADTENITVDVQALSSNISQLTGFKPRVSLDLGNDQPAQWDARFVRFTDSVDSETRTMGIVVVVDDPLKKVIPGKRPPLSKGMLVEVSISGHVQKNAIVVPRSALRNGNAYVLDGDNRLQIRAVKKLYDQQQFSVIASGIQAGDQLVLSDIIPAVSGMLLAPINNPAAGN